MEQLTESIGNPTALLIERIFWLCIGGFLGLAIISSIIRGLNEDKNKKKPVPPKELKKFAKTGLQQNNPNN